MKKYSTKEWEKFSADDALKISNSATSNLSIIEKIDYKLIIWKIKRAAKRGRTYLDCCIEGMSERKLLNWLTERDFVISSWNKIIHSDFGSKREKWITISWE